MLPSHGTLELRRSEAMEKRWTGLAKLYQDYLESLSQGTWDKFNLFYCNASPGKQAEFDSIQSQIQPRQTQLYKGDLRR